MSIGNSGRIVIEVDPHFKRNLYSALAKDGMSLKDWFLREVHVYLSASANPIGVARELDVPAIDGNERD